MGKKKFIKEYVEPIVIAVLIALFIRTVVFQAFKIPSSSMESTLLIGDYILVNKFIYGVRIPYSDKIFGESKKFFEWKKPQRGDVIVFIFPKDRSKDFIKRVIGTEGDKVDIVGDKIYIDNKVIDDPWGHYDKKADWERNLSGIGKFEHVDKVPKGHLLVLGDNRDNSQDSRFWGFVNISDVKGKALIIYFSGPSMLHILFPWTWGDIKWMRFGKLIH
jgi:signal peptidase I